jgi:hypothetical protein
MVSNKNTMKQATKQAILLLNDEFQIARQTFPVLSSFCRYGNPHAHPRCTCTCAIHLVSLSGIAWRWPPTPFSSIFFRLRCRRYDIATYLIATNSAAAAQLLARQIFACTPRQTGTLLFLFLSLSLYPFSPHRPDEFAVAAETIDVFRLALGSDIGNQQKATLVPLLVKILFHAMAVVFSRHMQGLGNLRPQWESMG